MDITFCPCGWSLTIRLVLVQCVTKIHSTVRVCRSKKETARQRNPCSLLIHAVLALSCTESVGRFKIQLALGEEIRGGGERGTSRKSFVYHSRHCSPSSSLCYDERSLQRAWGSACRWKWSHSWSYTCIVRLIHPYTSFSWAGCWCTGVLGGMCRNAKKSTACVKCKAKDWVLHNKSPLLIKWCKVCLILVLSFCFLPVILAVRMASR